MASRGTILGLTSLMRQSEAERSVFKTETTKGAGRRSFCAPHEILFVKNNLVAEGPMAQIHPNGPGPKA